MDKNTIEPAAERRWGFLRVATLGVLALSAGAGWLYYENMPRGSLAQTPAACPAAPASYLIKPTGPERFEVSLTLARSAEQLDIVSRRDDTRTTATDDFIKNVRHLSETGREIPLEYLGEGTWRMPATSEARPVVVYEIDASHDEHPWGIGKEEIAYNFDGSSFFTGWTVLLTDYASYPCPSVIEFDLPEGWSVAAPWDELGPNKFAIRNSQDLQKNGFALGPSMPAFSLTAGASNLTIVYEKAVKEIAEQTSRDADTIFKFYENIYGGPAGSNYTIFMVSDSLSDGGAFERSFAQRFAIPANEAEQMVWRHGFAHEVGHLWNGITIAPASPDESEWFKEGFTDYLTLKALLAIDALAPHELENKIETIVRRYYLSLFANGPMSLVEAGSNKQQYRMLVYGGGSLVALLLDGEMSRAKGEGAFEAMMAEMYAGRAERYTLEQLMQLLDAHSDGEASNILEALSSGIMPANLKARLARQGIDLGVFAPEELYIRFSGSNCENGETECLPAYFREINRPD